MLEFVVAALTSGAIVYHNLHADFFFIGLVAFSIGTFLFILFQSKRGGIFAIAIASAFVLGALSMWATASASPDSLFFFFSFEARVLAVDRRLDRTTIIVREEKKPKIQLFVYKTISILPGDTISVRARVEPPERFLTDNGRLFDYPRYLQSKGIEAIARNADITIQSSSLFSYFFEY